MFPVDPPVSTSRVGFGTVTALAQGIRKAVGACIPVFPTALSASASIPTMRSRRLCHLAAVALATSALTGSAATVTWNGNGANSSWSSGANWVGGTAPAGTGAGDTLIFGSGTKRSATINTVNDFRISATSGAALRFTSAVNYSLSGSSVVLAGNVSQTAASSVTIANDIKMSGGRTFALSNATGTINASGVISETGGSTGLTKTGAGTLILGGNNTYTGDTLLGGGTTIINGTNTSTSVAVGAGALLRGLGSIGNVLVEGAVQAGTNGSSGILNTGALTLADTASSIFTIVDPSLGSPSNSINSSGNVDFGLSTLVLDLPSSTRLPDFSTYKLFDAPSYSGNIGGIPTVSYLGQELAFVDKGNGRWEAYDALIEQSVSFDANTGTLMVVPEPSAIVLATMAGGMVGLIGIRRRRHRQSRVSNR